MSRRVPNSITCSHFPNHIRECARRGCKVTVTGVVKAEAWTRDVYTQDLPAVAENLTAASKGKRR